MENTTVIIDAQREAYRISEVAYKSMTVRELIEALEQFEEDAPVILSHDGGYTYGAIRFDDLEERTDESED